MAQREQENIFKSNKLIEAHGKAGNTRGACQVFRLMEYKDRFSWDFMLLAYSRNSQLHEAEQLFLEMPTRGLISCNIMLSAYSQCGCITQAQSLLDSMPQLTLVSWNTLLSALSQHGELQQSKSMFDRMPEHDLISWNSMFSGYVQQFEVKQAEILFDMMPEQNLVSWTMLLEVYIQNDELQRARALFDSMPERDLVAWTSMLAAYGEAGEPKQAELMFGSMPVHDLVSMTAMLSAYALNGQSENARRVFSALPELSPVSITSMLVLSSQWGNLKEAQRLFTLLGDEQTIVSWTAMLSAYAEHGRIEQALCMFEAMPLHNLVACNVILAAFISLGCHSEASSMFNRTMMERNVISWNIMLHLKASLEFPGVRRFFSSMPEVSGHSWTVMLDVLAHNCCWDEVFETFSEMKLSASRPENVSWAWVLISCSRKGSVEVGRSLFVSMSFDFEMEPRREHYGCVIDLLARAGYLSEAVELITNMPFEGEVWEWTCLMSGCFQHKNVEFGVFAARNVLRLCSHSPTFGSHAFVLLARTFCKKD